MWYAVHVIMLMKFDDGIQDVYPLWENVKLIEASSVKEASIKAREKAKEEDEGDQGSFTYNDRSIKFVTAGVRKIIECLDTEERPDDGTEITYSKLRVENADDLQKLINGDSVRVIYDE